MDKTTYFYPNRTLNARGRIVDLSTPVIMGILNTTPDSFYDGGQFETAESALTQATNMLKDGAEIIDVGGMSTRPGAQEISVEEELSRILPAISAIHAAFPHVPISVDTVHANTAAAAISAGASIINDVSGGEMDPEIIDVAKQYKTPYIFMHMRGRPETMQKNPKYSDVTLEVFHFLVEKAQYLQNAGITDIVADPGFGFGKTLEHNYSMLKHWDMFTSLGLPLLAGVSRKSMVCRLLDIPPAEALNGSTVLHALLLQKGVQILRVHDVREAVETKRIVKAMQNAQ